MNKIFNLFFILIFSISYGQEFQFAIISDKDGSVNVRSSNNTKENNIVDKLENGFVVTHFGAEGNWIHIDYKKNGKDYNGYVYKDRVKGITDFTKLSNKKSEKGKIEISNQRITITLAEKQFDKSKHTFKFYKTNPNQLCQIDEKDIFGTDGNSPKSEYSFIEIKIEDVKFKLPKEEIENLYEPNLEYTNANFDEKTETLYLHTLNGDGAGGYAVLWIINNGKVKKRIITIPF